VASIWLGSTSTCQRPGATDDFQIDIFTQRPPEKIGHSDEQLIDVGQSGIERLPSRESEQPVRQHRRTLRAVRGVRDHARQAFPHRPRNAGRAPRFRGCR
jgi:hypothetical protein